MDDTDTNQLGRALLGRPADPQILYQLGLAQAEFGYSQILGSAQQENIQAAIASFDLALKIQADYPEVLFERGSAQLQLGLLEEALEDLARAVELDPQNPEPVAQLGFASLQRASREANRPRGWRAQIVADYEDSVDALTKYFSLVPENPDLEDEATTEILRENVYVARAIANIGLGTELPDRSRDYYLRAIQDTDAAQELNPDFASPYYQKGVAQRMLGDLDAAVDSFTAALERNPADSEAMLRRGIVFFRQGDYELARADFEQSGLFSTNPARAKFWSGLANAKLGQYKRAIMDYSLALRYQGIFPYASLNRGLAHMKVGRFRPAIADFNEVLRRDKNNVTARSMRAEAQRLLAETS